MSECGCGLNGGEQLERNTLVWLLVINLLMFVVEGAVGWWAESTGLLADSLDMLADAAVYGIAFYAVGRALRHQAKAARVSGVLQIILGLGVLLEVVRRLLLGSEPMSLVMIAMGLLALLANLGCLLLIARYRTGGVHMRASWIFSTNDAIANIGVVVSGGLVLYFSSPWPDLIAGTLIALLVIRGGLRIIAEANAAA